jgi:predicted nucleic acid-binding protein
VVLNLAGRKPMKDNSFIDTNVLVYCYSKTEPNKRKRAIVLSSDDKVFISTQVLKEFSNILSKKFELDWLSIETSLHEVIANYYIIINSPDTFTSACRIADKYKYSFYDSLIIASALKAECKILFTEDMQHNQLIEKKLRIINPFIE